MSSKFASLNHDYIGILFYYKIFSRKWNFVDDIYIYINELILWMILIKWK